MDSMVAFSKVPAVPARPSNGHKGSFGTVVVIGGSPTMIGAPALCASAALRSGAGLVRLACPPEVLPFALTIEPEATGLRLTDSAPETAEYIHRIDPERRAVLAIGPGLGQADPHGTLVTLLLHGRRTVVLDADGLNLLARTGRPRPAQGPSLVLTPHPGEFARLAQPFGITASPTDPAQRPAAAVQLARAHHAVVVLKGPGTVVTNGTSFYVNATGNPALATAGSGDVLTGCIAALIAQGLSPFDAATLGVYLHGLAGDIWAAEYGPSGLTARDLAGLLPKAFQKHRQ